MKHSEQQKNRGQTPILEVQNRGLSPILFQSAAPVCLLGILDDGWAGLSDSARQRLTAADLVIGAGRTLELVRPHLAPGVECRDMDGKLGQVAGWIAQALSLIHI